MGVREYWQEVRGVREQIATPTVYLMSLNNRTTGTAAGVVIETDRDSAAECIVKRTHRIATHDEVDAYHAESARKADEIRTAEAQRMGRNQMVFPAALLGVPGIKRT